MNSIADTPMRGNTTFPRSVANAENGGFPRWRDSALGRYADKPTYEENISQKRFVAREQSSRWVAAAHTKSVLPPDAVWDGDLGGYTSKSTGEIYDRYVARPPRLARCGWTMGKTVSVHKNDKGAYYSNIETCSSIWSCPCCAPIIRNERAQEISRAVNAHQSAGGELVFLTLTLRHYSSIPLQTSLDTVLDGWGHLVKSASFKNLKNRYLISGYIRSIEVTYGKNGWHPHAHIILFVDKKLTDIELDEIGDFIHSRWSKYAYKKTGLTPSRENGVDVQRVDSKGHVLARYLSKVSETSSSWGVAAEVSRGDLKTSNGENIKPMDLLLDDATSLNFHQRYRLWIEYIDATFRRRAITWSRGLKARFGIDSKKDEEVLEDTVNNSEKEVFATLEREVYSFLRRNSPKTLDALLVCARNDDFVGFWDTLLPFRVYFPTAPPPR